MKLFGINYIKIKINVHHVKIHLVKSIFGVNYAKIALKDWPLHCVQEKSYQFIFRRA